MGKRDIMRAANQNSAGSTHCDFAVKKRLQCQVESSKHLCQEQSLGALVNDCDSRHKLLCHRQNRFHVEAFTCATA